LKDVRRIFKEYNITSDDLVEVRLNVQWLRAYWSG
jgi:hypothetical protein